MRQGPIISRDERAARLVHARRWRIDHQAYFDAIYGPETKRQPCLACAGAGFVGGGAA